MAKKTKIRARIGLTKLPDGGVTPRLNSSLNGLKANAAIYTKPPIDLATYEAGIVTYETLIPAALDGSKTVAVQKSKARDAVTKMYTVLAHYAEANCNEDMATFLLSGFEPVATTKTPAQPLATPTILTVLPGPLTGQSKVKFGVVSKAVSYDVQFGPAQNGGGLPTVWVSMTVKSTKPVIVGNLTPGVIYTFQVRAFGALGHTDWSDPVSRMAT